MQTVVGGVDVFSVSTVAPGIIFMIYLLYKLRLSIKILKNTTSLMIPTIYTFVWLVCVLNLMFTLITIIVATSTYHSHLNRNPCGNGTMLYNGTCSHYFTDNTTVIDWTLEKGRDKFNLELFIRITQGLLGFLIEFIELSVVVFMLHHGTTLSKSKVLTRTVLISGIIAAIDNALSMTTLLLFQIDMDITISGETTTMMTIPQKEGAVYEFTSSSVYVLLYLIIMLLPFTRLRDRVPERKSFYIYVAFLCLVDSIQLVGCVLILCCIPTGICFVSMSRFIYFAFYAPMLYGCFLGPVLSKSFYDQVTMELYQEEEEETR
ncbi:transmembrane protein [Acrasis kona]|uniref:Transmembrane protein n=1 Tax=Acrasis kona TaxID=1008807 RepID=A0AAW2ZHQ2_9EUKA